MDLPVFAYQLVTRGVAGRLGRTNKRQGGLNWIGSGEVVGEVSGYLVELPIS